MARVLASLPALLVMRRYGYHPLHVPAVNATVPSPHDEPA